MPDHQTQDGNCCRLAAMLDKAIGEMVPPAAADEVAELVAEMLAQDLHPRTQEVEAALQSLVMAGYATYLRREAAA
jgi:hypothetical protein